MNDLIP